LDFHAGEAVPEVVLDVPRYFQDVAEVGMQSVMFMTKDAFGNSYYDTRVGHKNSKLEGDLLAQAVEQAHERGIELIAYYNAGLNSHVAAANPDYRQRDADDAPLERAFGNYDILCLNSPYRDHVIDQLLEIADGYAVDGFFLDITYVQPAACYCDYCQRDYRAQYGAEAPRSPARGTIEHARWQAFRRDTRTRFLREAADALTARNPELTITWNHAGDLHFAHFESDQRAGRLASEFHPPDYLNGSLLARWNRPTGTPFTLMAPSELGSWGDWTALPAATAQTLAAIAVAGGGSITFGHCPPPSGPRAGALTPAALDVLRTAYTHIRDRAEWLTDVVSVPDTALLHCLANRRLLEDTLIEADPGATLSGAHRALVEGNIHFDVLSEHTLHRLDDYATLILPDQAFLPEPVIDRIRGFVAAGGLLLATHRTSLYAADGTRRADFALADVFGASFADHSRYTVTYLDLPADPAFADLPPAPILIKGAAPALRAAAHPDANVLAALIDPAVESRPHRHVYHQHAHPARDTGNPGIVAHRYGHGACVYLPFAAEASYWATGSPALRRAYLACLTRLRPQPLLEVDAPIGVEITLMAQPGRWILHLVQVREERSSHSPTYIEQIWPIHNITARIRRQPAAIHLAPTGEPIPFTTTNGVTQFTIPEVALHQIIVLDGID
jgi:hypothetical protein